MDILVENPALLIPVILAILGAFSAIARLTPNTADNKVADMIWKIVNSLGLRGGKQD
jgi:hypothetical protein